MGRVSDKALGFFWPALTAVLIGGQSFQGLEARGDVISHQDSLSGVLQVVMGLVVRRFHGGVLACAGPAFDVASGPGMVGCGQPMVDALRLAEAITAKLPGGGIARAMSDLAAMLGQHRMDGVRDGRDHVP
jgi:hypothetical protein